LVIFGNFLRVPRQLIFVEEIKKLRLRRSWRAPIARRRLSPQADRNIANGYLFGVFILEQ